MKTVAIYHKSVPNGKNLEKIHLLKFFSDGVKAAGDRVLDVDTYSPVNADVAMIQGWLGQPPFTTPHLLLRQKIISNQFNKHTITADSNLFLYSNNLNPHHYLRYSFDGVFPNTGIYCDTLVDPSRWIKIQQRLNISLKNYRTTGSHILLCLQRNGGWSMGNSDVQDWALSVIKQVRAVSDRPIVIRAHPGDKAASEYLNPMSSKFRLKNIPNIQISPSLRPLTDDLKNCWAVINHNSSAVVGAAIEGYPIFVTDPTKSQCKDIANTNLSQIENPQLLDRQPWAERISMFHWNFNEVKSGECWQHMRKFISNVT
jgi:hypothetical protein